MCKICNIQFDKISSLSKHLRMKHNYTLIDYYIKFEKFTIPKCKYCDNLCKSRNGIKFTITCCDSKCKTLFKKEKKYNNEDKLKMSLIRKEWLKNNPDKHPWKNNKKFISIPCEKLKEFLNKNNIKFDSEIKPLEDRFFSIDIAFIDKGIGIEVNGNQHYDNNKQLKAYYYERKKLIEEKGWKLYDIHYTKVYDEIFLSELLNMIKGEDFNLDLNFNFNREKKILKCKCGELISKYNKSGICTKCIRYASRKVERPSYEQLLIDIKELGYSGTGRKYGVSDNAIRKWIKNTL